jgi:hypothetical protein
MLKYSPAVTWQTGSFLNSFFPCDFFFCFPFCDSFSLWIFKCRSVAIRRQITYTVPSVRFVFFSFLLFLNRKMSGSCQCVYMPFRKRTINDALECLFGFCLSTCVSWNKFFYDWKKCLGFCLKFFVLLLLPWCREDLCYEGKRLPFILNMASQKTKKKREKRVVVRHKRWLRCP